MRTAAETRKFSTLSGAGTVDVKLPHGVLLLLLPGGVLLFSSGSCTMSMTVNPDQLYHCCRFQSELLELGCHTVYLQVTGNHVNGVPAANHCSPITTVTDTWLKASISTGDEEKEK